MKVQPLPERAAQRPENVVKQMVEAWHLALQDERHDLEAEARAFGVNEELFQQIPDVLQNRHPGEVLREFAKQNPHLPLRKLHEPEAYDVAVGMLRTYLRR
jgi:hypothetical protein